MAVVRRGGRDPELWVWGQGTVNAAVEAELWAEGEPRFVVERLRDPEPMGAKAGVRSQLCGANAPFLFVREEPEVLPEPPAGMRLLGEWYVWCEGTRCGVVGLYGLADPPGVPPELAKPA